MSEEVAVEIPVKRQRLRILDGIRGVAIFLMVLHHLIFNITYVFYDGSAFAKLCADVYNSEIVADMLQPLFQCVFIFISGVACRYSRSNLKRGIIALILGIGFEVITCYVLPAIDPVLFYGCEIRFGILNLLGVSMIVWAIFGKLLDKLFYSTRAGMIVPLLLLLLWFIFEEVASGYHEVENLYWLGFPGYDFSSADYFPIMPWIFMFLLGAYVGKFIHDGAFPAFFYRVRLPFFDFIGRYTIWIYLLHQPVIFGACYLFFELLGSK